MIETSFVASWWLMLCIICAQQVIYFLVRNGIMSTIISSGDDEND
jgi:hypothetical protein